MCEIRRYLQIHILLDLARRKLICSALGVRVEHMGAFVYTMSGFWIGGRM